MASAHAAELGDAQVRSHIGQALVADVELNLIEDPATPVKVRLAHPDVYRGANIAMPPVLSSLNMSVTRRDGRQFLHLTSLKPVESRHLHVYLELTDGGGRNVRLVTLWLTPDPNPAPAPAPMPVREAVAPQPAVLPAASLRSPAPVPRPAAALHAGEEYVEANGQPAASAPRKAAPKAPPKPVQLKPVQPKPVQPKPAPPKKVEAPALAVPANAPSCAPQPASAPLNACVALGEKNAALHQQLGKLEEKVKVLQGASATAPAIPAPAPAKAEAQQDHPKGAPRIHRKPKKPEPPAAETPWLLIGTGAGIVAALAALLLVLLKRRKQAGVGKIQAAHKPARVPKAGAAGEGEPKPHFMAAVKARLMPNRAKPARAPEAAEPVLEEAVAQPE